MQSVLRLIAYQKHIGFMTMLKTYLRKRLYPVHVAHTRMKLKKLGSVDSYMEVPPGWVLQLVLHFRRKVFPCSKQINV